MTMRTQALGRSLLDRALRATALSPLGALPQRDDRDRGDRDRGDKALRGSLIAALLLSPVSARAQLAEVVPQAGPAGAPRRDMAANGTPIVKIATPTTRGTSYNRYQSFNVDARGLILNNSAAITSTTLAGFIDGNSNLRTTGPASLIINEVLGTSRSSLRGYIEVAGSKADVVLANPYGISCVGCGFINAGAVTLAAAVPRLGADGALAGFSISNGSLDVGGVGLDASGARLTLLAQAITLNAAVFADRIDAAFGSGDARTGDQTAGDEIVVTARADAPTEKPAFGLDVAALGGMYARSIRLVGTEAGLGVNVAGTLSGLEGVSLSAAGRIVVGGVVTATTAATIASGESLTVDGQLYGEGSLAIRAGAVRGRGLIASGGDLGVTSGTIDTMATFAAGLARDGQLTRPGALALTSSGLLSLGGQVLARDAIGLRGSDIVLGGPVRASTLSATADRIVNRGDVRSAGALMLDGVLTNAGLLQGREVTVRGGALDNRGGTVDAVRADIASGAITNAGGLIQSTGALTLSGSSLANGDGAILALGGEALTLALTGELSSGGRIGGNGDVGVSASRVTLSGNAAEIIAAGASTVTTAGDLTLSGGARTASGGATRLTIGGRLAVEGGSVGSQGALVATSGDVAIGTQGAIAAASVDLSAARDIANRGTILSGGAAGATVLRAGGQLNNLGTLQANGTTMTIGAGSIANGGTIAHAGSGALALTSTGTTTNAGSIATNGDATVGAAVFDNRGDLSARGRVSVASRGALANSGSIAAGGALTASAATLNGSGGAFESGGPLSLTAGSIDLGDATVLAFGTAPLTVTSSGALSASGARLGGNGAVALTATSIDFGGSEATALGTLDFRATGGDLVLGRNAELASVGDLTLAATGSLDATGATIASDGVARLSGRAIGLDDGLLQADRFELAAPALSLRRARLRQTGDADLVLRSSGAIDFSGGELYSGGSNFTVEAGSLVTRDGALLHAGSGTFTIAVGGAIDNAGGRIATNGSLALSAAQLANSDGTISANRAGAIAVEGTLANAAGVIASGAGLRLAAGAVDNADGAIETQGLLDLRLGSLSGARGTLLATGTDARLALDARGAIAAPAGLIGSTGSVDVVAASIALGTGARLTAGGALTGRARGGDLALLGGTIDGASVTLTANGTVSTGAGGVIVTPGQLTLAGAVDLGGGAAAGGNVSLTGPSFRNAGGVLQAERSVTLDVGGLVDNSQGELFAGDIATITAGSLRNASGRVASAGAGTLTLTTGGLADNADGTIVGNGAVALTGDALVNDGGLIASTSSGALRIANTLSNVAGDIRTDRALLVEAGRIVNDRGRVDSLDALTVRAGTLANGTGSLVSRGGVGLTLSGRGGRSLDVDNGGTIGAVGALAIEAATIANRGSIEGSIAALRAGTLNNSGDVYAGTLTLGGGGVTNAGGRIGSGAGALTANVTSFDNRGGALVSGAGGLTVTSQALLNDGGTLGGAGSVALSGSSIDNGAGTIAAAGDLSIAGATLRNASGGAIWTDRNATLAITNTLTNRGSIAANGLLGLRAPTLDNGSGGTAGVIAAGDTLTVDFTAGSLGRLIGERALNLRLAGDYVNAAGQALSSRGQLNLSTPGSFTNEGLVESATGVGITATTSLTNAAAGEIISPTVSLATDGELSNLGIINGGVVTLAADRVVNGNRIFGDDVLVTGRSSIVNRSAEAVIATRLGLLALESAGAIENRDGATLYSLGDIAITGVGAGRAASLLNSSATIQAQGDILIAAGTVTNNRALFSTEEAIASRTPFQFENRTNRENRTILEYVETVTDTAITGDSGAATIVGRNIDINADSLSNTISTISASGDLNVGATTVSNTAFTGYHRTVQEGERRVERRDCDSFLGINLGCGSWRVRSRTPYDSLVEDPIFTIDSTITAGGSLVIDARTIDNLVVDSNGDSAATFAKRTGGITGDRIGAGNSVAGVTGGATLAIGAAVSGRKIAGVDAIAVDATTLGVSATGVPAATAAQFGFTLAPLAGQASGAARATTLDLGGLFRFAAPTATFLVETDPRFTNYGKFLSSDYFIGRLGYDPTRVQRRLGDALYEQQLVTNQLVAQAGVGRLANFASNEAQYRALMDAGVAYMQRYNLALGVALSAEQMATLTTDIVLLEEVTVSTPSGPTKVLAPRVYLTKIDRGNLTARGAVIAGTDLALRGADSLTNAGVLRATASARIVGGDVVNTGRIDLGARGAIAATRDLIDRGGTISGGDIALSAGRDLRLEPVATTSNIATFYRGGSKTNRLDFVTATTNRGSVVDASGSLDLVAGRTLGVTGATVGAGGDLLAYGGQNLAIGSALDTRASSGSGRNGKTSFTETGASTTNVLSTLTAGGNATLATPGALRIAGGAVVAGGALDVQAGNIAVSGVIDESRATRDTVRKSGGLLSSTTTKTSDSVTDQSVVASTLSGDTVAVRSVGDTVVRGSNIVATNGVTVGAGGALDIGTLTATDTSASSRSVKKSGISLSGGGLFAGVAKSSNADTATSVTNTGSLIGTENGDVSLTANRALTVTGSTVVSPGTTSLSGQSVTIQNATDTLDTSSRSKSSSAGLSVKLYENVSGAVNSVAGLPGRVDRGGQGTVGTAVTAVSETLRSVAAVTSALTNTAGVSANLGFSKSKSATETQMQTVVGSTIAGNDVAIVADEDVRVSGSSVAATRDLTLGAGRDIILESAQNRFDTKSSSSSSGAGIGVSVGVGIVGGVNASASVNANSSRSSGTTSETAQINTVIDAGRTLSLTSGRDTTLAGAVAIGRDDTIATGRDLNVRSVQDTAARSSSGGGVNLGLSFSPGDRSTGNKGGVGVSGGVSVERGSGSSAVVGEQTAIIARLGTLDARVGGATAIQGGVLGAVDGDGRDSGRLNLETGTLRVTDLADSARSRDVAIGVSANVNDPFRDGIKGANTPVIDGSYASTRFDGQTRGTIGAGTIGVAQPAGSTDPATINRDLDATMVVTRNSATGFTVYADEAAAREVGALATGDRANSVILQGAAAIAARPLGVLEDAAAEIKALGNKPGDPATRTDSQLEKLVSQLGSALLPASVDLAAREAAIKADFRADALSKGYQPSDVDVAMARLDAKGVFAEWAKTDRRDALEREAYRVSPTRLDRSSTELNAAAVAGTTRTGLAPAGTTPVAADPDAPTVDEIVVTARRREGSGVPSLVHNSLGALGAAYSGADPITQRIITSTMGVLSDGVIGAVTGEVVGGIANRVAPGAVQALGGAINTLFVGADSYLQNRSFSPVKAENDTGDNSRRTPDAVVGTGLVVSALPIIATVRTIARATPNTPPGGRPRTCSFDGATLVRTLAGLTPIRWIRAGIDQVWSRDAATGATGYKRVEAHYANPYDVTVRVSIRDAAGRTQVITSNRVHPFFVQLPAGTAEPRQSAGHRYSGNIARGAWIDAAELKPGYRLLNEDGSWATVTGTTVKRKPLTAYNLTVNGFHTYFVTGDAEASPVWVHNDCFTGQYEPNPKHDQVRAGVSPQPTNPEQSLASSVSVGGNSNQRIAYDAATGEIVTFQLTQGNTYHGYVVPWNKLPQQHKNALIRDGKFSPKGRSK